MAQLIKSPEKVLAVPSHRYLLTSSSERAEQPISQPSSFLQLVYVEESQVKVILIFSFQFIHDSSVSPHTLSSANPFSPLFWPHKRRRKKNSATEIKLDFRLSPSRPVVLSHFSVLLLLTLHTFWLPKCLPVIRGSASGPSLSLL